MIIVQEQGLYLTRRFAGERAQGVATAALLVFALRSAVPPGRADPAVNALSLSRCPAPRWPRPPQQAPADTSVAPEGQTVRRRILCALAYARANASGINARTLRNWLPCYFPGK